MRAFLVTVLLAGALACEHSQPAGPAVTGSGPLPRAGVPAQLTYNPGQDRTPTWLPDGSAILYSAELLSRQDRDRCLAEIPPTGGQVLQYVCDGTPAAAESIDVLESPAVTPDGRLAVVQASTPDLLGGFAPLNLALAQGSLRSPSQLGAVQRLPFTSPSGTKIDGLSHLAWLSDGSLMMVGDRVAYARVCDTCIAFDTLETGLELIRVSSTGVLATLLGTDGASSVAAGRGDTIYLTRNGDSRLFRRALTASADSIVRDFNGLVARDVAVAGSRLVAVVGGMVYYRIDSTLGPSQRDYGGDLHVSDLHGGTDSVLGVSDPSVSIWFRRPALSPDGRLLVAEGRPYKLIRHTNEAGVLLYTDTIIPSAANLYEYRLP